MNKNSRIIIAGILAGTILEWYDFSLLGTLAPFIAHHFFPSQSAIISLLATFGVFATGFIARPLGGLIFGHIGDRHGRKPALSFTILLMAIPTTLIGLLPTYQNIGFIAPLILILLRILQGLASSGEYPGAICVLTEMAPKNKKNFYSSLSMLGVVGGVGLGSFINMLLTSLLYNDQLTSWGWRIPFLLGLPLSAIGWALRKRLQESELFKNAPKAKLPIRDIMQTNFKNLLSITLLFSLSAISFYIGFVYISGYLVNAHLITLHDSMINNGISTMTLALLIPIFGYLADKYNQKIIMTTGILSLLILFYPIFLLFSLGNAMSLLAGQLILALAIAIFVGPLANLTAETFSTHTRYTGTAASINIGTTLFGGSCPLVATYLVHQTGSPISPCFYPIVVGMVCLIVFYRVRG